MVVHCVFFRMKPDYKNQEEIARLGRMLKDLRNTVPSLRSLELGINQSDEARAMDLSIITRFDDWEGLRAYAVDPHHQELIAHVKQVCEETRVVDYMLEEEQ